MLKELGSLMSLMNNRGKIQEEVAKLQQTVAQMTAEGTAGAGMVTVRVNGKMEVLGITIGEEAWKLNDREMLEDLIAAATNQALAKVRDDLAAVHSSAPDAVRDVMARKDAYGGRSSVEKEYGELEMPPTDQSSGLDAEHESDRLSDKPGEHLSPVLFPNLPQRDAHHLFLPFWCHPNKITTRCQWLTNRIYYLMLF